MPAVCRSGGGLVKSRVRDRGGQTVEVSGMVTGGSGFGGLRLEPG